MPDIIYSRSSKGRKPEFQLVTRLSGSRPNLVASKMAAQAEAQPHLDSFERKRNLLINSNIKCGVAKVHRTPSNEAIFEFIRGVSLERKLELALDDDDSNRVLDIFNEVFNIIDSLPTQNVLPSSNKHYLDVFGAEYTAPVACISPACIDFGLDNLIEKNDELTLIDYEWVYDFPVPVDFIKLRVLRQTFWEQRSQYLKKNPATRVVAFGTQFYVPEYIYKRYNSLCTANNVKTYLNTETHFIDSILLHKQPPTTNVRKVILTAGEFLEMCSPFAVEEPKLFSTVSKQDFEIGRFERMVDLLSAEKDGKQRRIERLENTLTYKFIQRAEIRARERFRKLHRRR